MEVLGKLNSCMYPLVAPQLSATGSVNEELCICSQVVHNQSGAGGGSFLPLEPSSVRGDVSRLASPRSSRRASTLTGSSWSHARRVLEG